MKGREHFIPAFLLIGWDTQKGIKTFLKRLILSAPLRSKKSAEGIVRNRKIKRYGKGMLKQVQHDKWK